MLATHNMGLKRTGLVVTPFAFAKAAPHDITEYGFSPKFRDILLKDFPDAGSYMGSVANIGL